MMQSLIDQFDPVSPLAGALQGHKDSEGKIHLHVGSSQSLAAQFVWYEGTAAIGSATISIRGNATWDAKNLQHEDWTHFLKCMASAWDRVCAEESYPFGAAPYKPSDLQAYLEGSTGSPNALETELVVQNFRAAHDLTKWLPADLEEMPEPFWIVREGLFIVVECNGDVFRLPGSDTLWALEQIGEAISKRLFATDRENRAVALWRARYDSSPQAVRRLFLTNLGLPEGRANQLLGAKILRLPKGRAEVLAGLDEVRAAARMLPLSASIETVGRIAKEIRSVLRVETQVLDDLASQAREQLVKFGHGDARDQGIVLAQWLREKLQVSNDKRVDPEALLRGWGIEIKKLAVTGSVEAISFWGSSHGPAILLNPNSKHNRTTPGTQYAHWEFNGAQRFTLAHEICHLLIDRAGSLPVAEVLGGATPNKAEKRANIFAAHLLIPIEQTAIAYRNARAFHACVDFLIRTYRVSKSLAVRQLWWREGQARFLQDSDHQKAARLVDSGELD